MQDNTRKTRILSTRKKHAFLPSLLCCLLPWTITAVCSCTQKPKEVSAIFHDTKEDNEASCPDLPQLEENGEIIAVTLSGPQTYFEFRGQSFGLQYELIADFARKHGLRIRMEIAHDTTELLRRLDLGEADVIALPLPHIDGYTTTAIQDSASNGNKAQGWITRASSPQLAEALNAWYNPAIKQRIIAEQQKLTQRKSNFTARHTPRPKVKDAKRGIISDYDSMFRRHAHTCGWDWRLLAAQCFQESAFDPQAVSWAGAQGLMQLMPSTASHYGVSNQVFDPDANIRAATRLLKDLDNAFTDISDRDERISFILASYNGGQGHIRDAMALTQKYGGNEHRWSEVSKYILLLSEPQYYRDPVVRFGYLRGTETANYVTAIRSHWAHYRGIAPSTTQ